MILHKKVKFSWWLSKISISLHSKMEVWDDSN